MKNTLLISVIFSLALTNCQKEKITLSAHVDEAFYVDNDGASMKVTVKGNVISKVIILIVHGGPGGTASQYPVQPFVSNNYAVAYWDQRIAGSSQGGNNASTVKLDTYVDDLKKVIITINYRYGQDINVFLFGHSWGGFLTSAFLTSGNNQQMVKGWIYCEGVHNFHLLNDLVKEKLLSVGNAQLAAHENVSQWQSIVNYCHSLSQDITIDQSLKLNEYATTAEEVSLKNVSSEADKYAKEPPRIAFTSFFVNDRNPLNLKLYKDLIDVEFSSTLYTVTIPVLVVGGKFDFTTPQGLGDDVMARIGSSVKTQLFLDNSGHNIQEWDKCMQEVVKFIDVNK